MKYPRVVLNVINKKVLSSTEPKSNPNLGLSVDNTPLFILNSVKMNPEFVL